MTSFQARTLADENAKEWEYSPVPSEATIVLDHSELVGFEQLATRLALKHGGRSLDDPTLLAGVEIGAHSLPHRLLSRLIEFRTIGNNAGILLIRNLPVDRPLPPTPLDGRSGPSWSALVLSTVAQLGVMSVLGEVIAYQDEKEGRLVQDVCSVPGAEDHQENTGNTLLELHVEDGFHPFKPELISLYCLRGDRDHIAATVTASVKTVIDGLSAECLATLREPVSRLRFSTSFIDNGPARYSPPLAVLKGPVDNPDLCVDFYLMEPIQDDAAWALESLHEAMKGMLVGSVLEPGDMLVADNRVAVHGRTGFSPRYDGADRWLRRSFAVADLRPSRSLRPHSSRVCTSVL